ncbi:MAG TPA: hypothetical protein DEP38_04175, partial [Cyanobacteria bacterium UBA9226]|nr:hypothetical protein [Cyanobacteria bacterium UBA9226]
MNEPPTPQRHHIDPPGLWGNVILGSAIVHLAVFGLLSVASMGFGQKLPQHRDFIAVDLISPPAKANSLNPASQVTPVNRQTATINRQTFSTGIKSAPPSNSQPIVERDNSQTGEKLRWREAPTKRSHKVSPSPSLPSPKTLPPSPKTISPTPNPQQQTKPSPNSSPTQSHDKPAQPSSPNAGLGFFATPGKLHLTDTSRDIPNQPAKPKPNNKTEFTPEYLDGLQIPPGQVIQLKVTILIDETGKARLPTQEEDANPTQILSGKISIEKAKQLANRIIAGWQFEPTSMENSPVSQAYNLEI